MDRKVRKLDASFPAKPKLLNVVAYGRVSSGKDAMLHSLSAQVSYYSEMIQNHPGWDYCGVYADATVIIGLKQNPTNGRRFSPIFFALSGILWGKTQDATMNQGGKQNTVRAKAFAVY